MLAGEGQLHLEHLAVGGERSLQPLEPRTGVGELVLEALALLGELRLHLGALLPEARLHLGAPFGRLGLDQGTLLGDLGLHPRALLGQLGRLALVHPRFGQLALQLLALRGTLVFDRREALVRGGQLGLQALARC